MLRSGLTLGRRSVNLLPVARTLIIPVYGTYTAHFTLCLLFLCVLLFYHHGVRVEVGDVVSYRLSYDSNCRKSYLLMCFDIAGY